MCAAGPDVRRPFVEYADDKKDPDNYVRISVDIPGLKKKSFSDAASNADISLVLSDRSFTIKVTLEPNSKKKEMYEFSVKKLPNAISTDSKKSYWKVKTKDEVLVYLHKVTAGSWARYLSSVGLETAEPEEND